MPPTKRNLILKNKHAGQRYELHDEGQLLGFVEYHSFTDILLVTHTEINSAFEGKGYGSELVRLVLEDVGSRCMRVVPVCGFFAAYIRKHPKWRTLVTPEGKRIFNI